MRLFTQDCTYHILATLYGNKFSSLGFQKAEEGQSRDDNYITNLTDKNGGAGHFRPCRNESKTIQFISED